MAPLTGQQPRLGQMARSRPSRPALAALAFSGAVAWCCSSAMRSVGFVQGSNSQVLRRRSPAVARSEGSFAFAIERSDDHKGLLLAEQEENRQRISLDGAFHEGHYNTVLGNKELPQSGRHYWEVKIISKPTDAWEFIGVAEPKVNVSLPLKLNKGGIKSYTYASTWDESMVYTFMPMKPGMNDMLMGEKKKWVNRIFEMGVFPPKTKLQDVEKVAYDEYKDNWSGPGTHVGQEMMHWPKFKSGMVVGVDVNMDDGTLAFWADGKFLGLVPDHTQGGKPVNLKGMKLVPAMSIYGRTSGTSRQNTVIEVRTGMTPPARP